MLDWFRRIFQLAPAASTFADGVDSLHFFVLATTLLGASGITLITLGFLLRYRERAPGEPTPRVVATRAREGLLIATLLSLFLGWWVLGYRQYLLMHRRQKNAATVYVTAKQWMWKFAYSNGARSNDVLTLPVNAKVELIMTSRDVIHSFFVPAFRVKQDVLPGRYVSLWFEPTRLGTFPLFCAEYCGISHSRMLGRIRVLSAADYAAWLERESSPGQASAALAARGREAAVKHGCLACHSVDGQPHIGPTWSRLYGATIELQGGKHVVADAAYLTRSMMDPAAEVAAGFRPLMPTYLGSLAQPDVAAIVEYIRTLALGPEPGSENNPPLPRTEPVPSAGASSNAREPSP
jgi:cytochrome c oxidase subunit 2